MKKLQLIVLSLIIFCPAFITQAQDFNSMVHEMSQAYPGGSARMLGLGGSKVSLGGDVGNIYMNPAGLGFFNSSEWSFTPAFNFVQTNSNYLGTNNSDNKMNMNIGSLGVVFNRTKRIADDSKWRGGSFAFTMNRINDYHYDATYQGSNPNEDIIDYAVYQENYFNFNDITDLLKSVDVIGDFEIVDTGQETIFINGGEHNISDMGNIEFENGNILFTDRNIYDIETGEPAIPSEEYPVLQREEIRSRGSEYATSISYGGNYNDRIYFGAGLNFMTIDKTINRVYTENPTESDLTRLTFQDDYNLTGSGINFNLGLIARPSANILLGLSYSSPTFYGMEETRELAMVAEYTTGSEADQIIYLPFSYNLTMPSKLRGGITYFFGKEGFISADIQSSKTANARFSNGGVDYSFQEDNDLNKELFTNTIQAGVGGEYRMDMFRFRGGVSYITDPSEAESIDLDRMMFGLGVGLRKKNFFIDLAYNQIQSRQQISPYPFAAELATVEKTNNLTSLTVGFNF